MQLLPSAAAAAAAAIALACIQAVAARPACNADKCYEADVPPLNCKPDEPCAAVVIHAVVCPWTCGEPVPANCAERCKPCPPGQICPAVCICEKVCPKYH
ncbi:hypothetical protein H4R21_000052 [Coemansia helicoidea]|uniref:Uncharacterized protein n=1 Tax=Coemansia helicoidea TaxID=1286919 RepID=A0ACC1LI23_9FUNG|nr:hypothetical protein H4R21_000052 [Coemansia helicoidea]